MENFALSAASQTTLAELSATLWWSPPQRSSVDVGHHGALSTLDCTERLRQSLQRAVLCEDGGPFVELDSAASLAAARPGGRPAGALESVLVGVKDNIAVRGLRRRAGSKALAGATAELADAVVVRQLRTQGAVVVGTTAMHELAFGTTGVNEAFGSAHHPLDSSRICGGSSSGSACAVALGVVDLALGTDTGGSVRIPAALCGVVGFKPSYASYSTDAVLALAPSLDHVGLHARSVDEIARAHVALVGAQAEEECQLRRVGYDPSQLASSEPDVRRAVTAVLERLRTNGVELIETSLGDERRVFDVTTAILFAEAMAVHRRLVDEHGEGIGADVAERFVLGSKIAAHLYVAAQQERARISAASADVLAELDAVIGPTVPITAPTFAEVAADRELASALVRYTRHANLTGTAALSLPLGASGLPVGLQIAAATNERCLVVAGVVEELVRRS